MIRGADHAEADAADSDVRGLSSGASCDLGCNGISIPWPVVDQPLDQTACTIRVVENLGESSATATVTADILTLLGLPVELRNGQSVTVNGQTLTPADIAGEYSGTIPVANVYAVTVTEPSRGVQTTSQPAPPDFAITAPSAGGPASLSGFTVSDSNADATLQVSITLVQTLFGVDHRVAIGPFADTGSKVLTAQDLAVFRQGADLAITVTRRARAAR